MEPPSTPPPEIPIPNKKYHNRHSPKKTMRALPQLSDNDGQMPVFARSSKVADKFLVKFQKHQKEKELQYEHSPKMIDKYSIDENIVSNQESSKKSKPLFTPQIQTIHVNKKEEEQQRISNIPKNNDDQHSSPVVNVKTSSPKSNQWKAFSAVSNTVKDSKVSSSGNGDLLNEFSEMESQLSSFRVITEQEFQVMADIKQKYQKMLDYLKINEKVLNESESQYEKNISEIEKYWANMAKICQQQSKRLCTMLTDEYQTAKKEIATESQTIYNHISLLYNDMKQLKENVSKPVKSIYELRERSSMTQRLSQINLGSLTQFINKGEFKENGSSNLNDNIKIIENMKFDININWDQIESVLNNPNNHVNVKNGFRVMDLTGNPVNTQINKKSKTKNKYNNYTRKKNTNNNALSMSNNTSYAASNEMSISKTDLIDQLSNTNNLSHKMNRSKQLTKTNFNDNQISSNNVPTIPTTVPNDTSKPSRSIKQKQEDSIGKLEAKDYHHTRASLSFDEELKQDFLKTWQNDELTNSNTKESSHSMSQSTKIESKQKPITNNDNNNSNYIAGHKSTKSENIIDSTLFCFTRDGDIHECRIEIDISNDKSATLLANKWNLTENEPEIANNDLNNVTNGMDDQSTEFFYSQLLHRTKYPAVCLDETTKRLYRFGGVLEGTQLGLAESYDTQQKLWNTNSYQQLPIPRQEALALQLNSDNIIVCGGAAKLPKYNSSDLNEKSLILNSQRASSQATEWHFYNICDEFHVSKNKWNSILNGKSSDSVYDSVIANMNQARYAFSGIVIPGEYKAIITGGNGPNGRTNTTEMYDRVNNEWKYLSAMPNIKARHGSCWYDSMNTMIVVGGDTKSNSKNCFVYDMEKDEWFQDMPKLNKEHDRPVVKCYEDKSIVIVFGHNAKLNSFELLDGRVANSKWQVTNVRNHPINIDFRAGMTVV